VELLTSSLLHARHGFPLRTGGVSAPPFDSLNASFTVGDDESAVRENMRRVARAAGVVLEQLRTVRQVHGHTVVNAADAVWTATPQTAVGVRTADCLPLLMEDGHGAVAAVHAGWRGVVSRIAVHAVEQLVRHGARPEEIVVAVGPGIHACCFEVDDGLADTFRKTFGLGVVRHPVGTSRGKLRVDLYAAVRLQLLGAGVQEKNMEVFEACTGCDTRFFSHRRERGVTGRQLSFIVAP
jgi:YfiH family protein